MPPAASASPSSKTTTSWAKPTPAASCSTLSEPQRVKLAHIIPDQVRALLHATLLNYVTFDKSSGTVIVNGPEPIREKILDAIAQIDKPRPQVAIDAVVFELAEAGSKQLALDWQFKAGNVAMSSNDLVQTLSFQAGTDLGTYVQATCARSWSPKRAKSLLIHEFWS